jgi:hypothetical protein
MLINFATKGMLEEKFFFNLILKLERVLIKALLKGMIVFFLLEDIYINALIRG